MLKNLLSCGQSKSLDYSGILGRKMKENDRKNKRLLEKELLCGK